MLMRKIGKQMNEHEMSTAKTKIATNRKSGSDYKYHCRERQRKIESKENVRKKKKMKKNTK